MINKYMLPLILGLFIVLLVLCKQNKDTLEPFNPDIVKSLTDQGEQAILFCKALRDIDQKTNQTILLSKISRDMVTRGENNIKSLMKEIQNIQKKILDSSTENKIQYEVARHRDAAKQKEILDQAKENIQGHPVQIKLV